MITRIFLVEDHALMREALTEFVDAIDDCEVCGTAETGADALARVDASGAHLAIVDISLPDISGISLVGKMTARFPTISCLMLSGHGERSYVQQSLEAGARGFVQKGDPSELPLAIKTVLSGATYLSPSLHR